MQHVAKIIFFLFFLIPFRSAVAQQNQFHVPRSQTHDSKKLAYALTVDLTSDSAKIDAIHYWITHHIKYNVRKFVSFNYDHVNVKKILRKRKCTCVGYSDLLNELCLHSGLKSVSVPGYVKTPYVDLGDKCYIESHQWNAVYLNGKWELVDPTWDAGYVSFQKTSPLRLLFNKASFGLIKPSKLKMHFVQRPSLQFYLRPGKYFISTHLPINPIWQNLRATIEISQFETDSAYYFKRFDESADTFFIDKNLSTQSAYYQLTERAKHEIDGYAAFTYNNRNYYERGISYKLSANHSAEQVSSESSDTLAKIQLCTKAFVSLNNAKDSFLKNDSLLRVQYHELMDRNREKKAIFKKVNDQFLHSTMWVERSFIRCKKMHRSFKERARNIERKNRHDVGKLNRTKLSAPKISRHQTATKDSIRIDSLLNLNFNKISALNLQLKHTSRKVDSIYKEAILKIARNDSTRLILCSNETGIVIKRAAFVDDLDYEIRENRELILSRKLSNDSLLFINDTSLLRYFYFTLRKEKEVASNLQRVVRERLTLLKKMKTSCVNFNPIESEYLNTVDIMMSVLDQNSKRQNDFIDFSSNIKNASRRLLLLLNVEKKIYVSEEKTESDNSKVRADYFKDSMNSLLSVSKSLKTEVEELTKSVEKVKRNFSNISESNF